MAIYIILAVVLWLMALIEAAQQRRMSDWPGYFALFLFVAFAGTRFETGYDWMAYQETFADAPTFYGVMTGQQSIFSFTPMERLYAFLNVFVKSLWGDIQVLFFLTALFNGIVIFRFAKRFGGHPAFCLAFYFCFAYLTGQMTLVRQSLASSFVFLAIMFYFDEKKYRAVVLALSALGFHISAVMFYPIVGFLRLKPSRALTVGLILTGLVIYFFSDSVVGVALEGVKLISFGYVDEKVNEYMSLGGYKRSIGSLVYIGINIGFVWLSVVDGERKNWPAIERLFFYFCLMLVLSQLFFGPLPVIWNRIQIVVVVMQSCVFTIHLQSYKVTDRLFLVAPAAILSLIVLAYFLARPRMEPFIPYQSTLEQLFYDDVGDGRLRLEGAIRDSVAEDLFE